MQHRNVYITWDYWKFPSNPVATENFETRGRNNIILYLHYMVDTSLGKGVCAICWIPCAFTSCVAQLHKYGSPNNDSLSQPSYTHVESYYYNTILEHKNN